MVWFTFTFLLGIPNSNEEKLKDTAEEKGGKFQVEKSHIEIEVTKPYFMCHIEYVLIPNEAPKFVDVVCWNKAAKVYFENSMSAVIPLEMKKLKWIHFRVNHNVKLTRENIPLFLAHNVKFTISLGSKKFGELAKSDKTKKFFGPNFSVSKDIQTIRKQIFQPLSETAEDLASVSYFKEHLTSQQQLHISLDTTLETSENYKNLLNTLYELSREYHDETSVKKPTSPCREIPPIISIAQLSGNQENIALKALPVKKQDKKSDFKNREPEKMEFSITGEQFFSGRKIFENCLKYNSKELPFVFSLATVKNLLSKAQSQLYNPLSIVISRLNDLPVELLKKNGVNKIKFRFLICNHLLAESNLIPIDKEMRFNYARTVFTNAIDKEKLIYFIQTGGLHVEILGNVDNTNVHEDNTYSNKITCAADSEEMFVTLGRVSADISTILLQPHRTFMKCNFQMSNDGDESCEWERKDEFTSTNEFNSYKPKREKPNSFNLSSALSPLITITAGLGYPLFNKWQAVTMNPDLYNRLFVVFHNLDLAIPVIQIIQNEVNEILGPIDYIRNGKNLKRPLTNNHSANLANANLPKKTQMTGFLIDCVDKILIFAESSVFGGIQKVWTAISYMNPMHGHILYDSSLIFLSRLYENFFRFGGFIAITLKEPLHVILSKPQSYGGQNMPKPTRKALTCLSLLTDCKSIRIATKNNLFPDFQSLASLAIEFGTPIQSYERR